MDSNFDTWLNRVSEWVSKKSKFTREDIEKAKGILCLNNETLLHYFAVEGMELEVAFLAKNGWACDVVNEIGSTPLVNAVNVKNLAMIECLLNNGADVNFQDEHGDTPLHHAMDVCQTMPKVVELLIDRGARKDIKNAFGDCPGEMADYFKDIMP